MGLLLLNCVTLDKLFKIPELQFSPLQSGDNSSTFLTGSFWTLNEITYVKSLEQTLYLAFKTSESIIVAMIFECLNDFPS